MAKQLYSRIGEIGVDDLLADPQNSTYVVTDEQIAEGASFRRGQLVTYDKTNNIVKAVTAGTDVPFGIVASDVNCSDDEEENGDTSVRVYVSGTFNAQSQLLDAGSVTSGSGDNATTTALDINSFYVALRERGIILRNRAVAE